jgi:hypothetical protein
MGLLARWRSGGKANMPLFLRSLTLAVGAFIASLGLASETFAQPTTVIAVIQNAASPATQLDVYGTNFVVGGVGPASVTLGGHPAAFVVTADGASNDQLTITIPGDVLASGPGTYQLKVSQSAAAGRTAIYEVALPATGPPGPPGEPADVIASIDVLDGAACTVNGSAGTVAVNVGADGAISLLCEATTGGGGDGGGGGGGDDGGGDGEVITELCDAALAINDPDALNAAKALGLCTTTTTGSGFGVINAAYVRANGAPATPALQVGLLQDFGPNNTPRAGSAMLVLSSGRARDLADAGACGSLSCTGVGSGTPPPGFPAAVTGPVGACPAPASVINDDVGLQVTLRAPAGAVGFSFDYKFFTFEYPEWVCTSYSDHFLVLMDPAPAGATNGNVAQVEWSGVASPVTTSSAPLESCTPALSYPCALGTAALQGTGFDVWNDAAATDWETITVPVSPGQEFTLRFVIMDVGDTAWDSTVLLDNFKWLK